MSVLHCIPCILYHTENSAGTKTDVTGTAGTVVSPNYPLLYPNSFSHTWTITVSPGSTIRFTITDLKTEDTTDTLKVSQFGSGLQLSIG